MRLGRSNCADSARRVKVPGDRLVGCPDARALAALLSHTGFCTSPAAARHAPATPGEPQRARISRRRRLPNNARPASDSDDYTLRN